MSEDFYCDEVLSGRTLVKKVIETPNVLAYHHTPPFLSRSCSHDSEEAYTIAGRIRRVRQ